MRDGHHSGASGKQVQRTATETHVLTPEIARPPSKTPQAATSAAGRAFFLGISVFSAPGTSSLRALTIESSPAPADIRLRCCVSPMTHRFC